MSNNKAGGAKAAKKIKELYGEDYFKEIGSAGGSAPHSKPRGFAYLKATGQIEKLRAAGEKGGTISRRPKKVTAG